MAHPLHTSESLRRLSEADYEVAGGEYDVRGWHVVDATDERVGKVHDLIIDPVAGKVRYLEVDVDRKMFALERDRRVLIPIGSAQLDPEHKHVCLSGMTRAAFTSLPDYTGANLARDYDDVYRGHSAPRTRQNGSPVRQRSYGLISVSRKRATFASPNTSRRNASVRRCPSRRSRCMLNAGR